MPKSDTWPGGTESATMNGMDSAGSCDSVVSANSGFSEDSLEHLSAEEKACLMFLEETIESLENEDDSGLSHDEPEQLPAYGNISAKLADLSHSLGKSNINSSQKPSNQPIKKNVDTKHMQSYLIPTPLVVASGSQCSVPSTKSLTPVDKTASPKSQFRFKHNKPAPSHNEKRTAPPVPSGVNVIPPSTKPRENSAKPAEGPLTRGPLSYDALVHLRRNASQKKTPLCPTVDHTIDLDRQCPPPLEVSKLGNVTKPDKSLSDMNKPKVVPPVVPPKPKKMSANIYPKIQNESLTADLSESVKQATNPEVVRLEALQKLGLLKGHEHKDGAKPLSKKPARDPSDPTRNALFCSSQETTEPKNRPLKNSASVHQPSKEEQQPVLLLHVQSQSSGLKTEGLEHSAKQDDYKNKGKHPQHKFYGKPTKTATTSQSTSDTPVDSVGYTAMMVPGVGSDRKEALRKLGLLKS
ncbi:specifically androgen-regulated gene protein-like [Poecilia formosa]|uniref:Zgc:158258 n=1 Tax=Poecilia formosa TaxID=48698 RepID=A0A087YEF3_POEFO|nr:PREDICTED: specifically androgen-regulated gene protein-like [Poecilia formosa]XP_016524467.1 PREDICTED: specifically androgen-regulated gene protein-like [Poecilia formosa]